VRHAAGEVEMVPLARALRPPFAGPWYDAGADLPDEGGPGAESLAPVVGLWSLRRRGVDPEFTAAAMYSVARLLDGDARRTAGACLLAIAAAEAAAGVVPDGAARAAWASVARRWARTEVPEWAGAVLDAFVRHPDDPRSAAAAARAGGADERLAAAVASARGPSRRS